MIQLRPINIGRYRLNSVIKLQDQDGSEWIESLNLYVERNRVDVPISEYGRIHVQDGQAMLLFDKQILLDERLLGQSLSIKLKLDHREQESTADAQLLTQQRWLEKKLTLAVPLSFESQADTVYAGSGDDAVVGGV